MHMPNTIAADETWTADTSPHIVASGSLDLRAKLTLEPCTIVQLGPGVGISIAHTGGVLEALGQDGKFVVIAQNVEGTRWGNIQVRPPGLLKLAWTVVAGGGDDNFYHANISAIGASAVPYSQLVYVDHVGITDSKGFGITFSQYAGFVDGSQALLVSKAGAEDAAAPNPIFISSNALGSIPNGMYTGNASDLIKIATDGVTQDVTMHDVGVPYMVGGGVTAGDWRIGQANKPLATLTIEPGVELRFAKDARFDIGAGDTQENGALVATGTGKQIVMTAAVQGEHWAGVRFSSSISATNHLELVTVDSAGGASGASDHACTLSHSDNGAISFYAQPPSAFVTNCTISNTPGNALVSGWDGTPVEMASQNMFMNIGGCNQTANPDQLHACAMPVMCP